MLKISCSNHDFVKKIWLIKFTGWWLKVCFSNFGEIWCSHLCVSLFCADFFQEFELAMKGIVEEQSFACGHMKVKPKQGPSRGPGFGIFYNDILSWMYISYWLAVLICQYPALNDMPTAGGKQSAPPPSYIHYTPYKNALKLYCTVFLSCLVWGIRPNCQFLLLTSCLFWRQIHIRSLTFLHLLLWKHNT